MPSSAPSIGRHVPTLKLYANAVCIDTQARLAAACHHFFRIKADIADSNPKIDGILKELGREKNRYK